ncbi:hypothetical protein LJR231_006089 [Phyllobacterium sp. LjRoot231]|uniref:hypothetical protein n=1 Tax=Phyllobacterium sp. LjRoot231 TaxID=3342289 RepID=UPI003ECFF30E
MADKSVYDPVPPFIADENVETMVYVHKIARNDETLTIDVYTRNERHARQALEDLGKLINDMLIGWDSLKYRNLPIVTDDKGPPLFDHYRGEWGLNIHWPEAPK